jgi:hypothetical protein
MEPPMKLQRSTSLAISSVLEVAARPGQQLSAAEIDEIAKATFSFDHGVHQAPSPR